MTDIHTTLREDLKELTSPANLLQVAFIAIILIALYLISTVNYLLFHGIIELAGIAVAFSIFIIVWNTRRVITDGFFLIIGISFLFFGSIDLVHTLAFKGMGVFPGNSSDLPTQLWIAARYFQSITFLVATLFIGRSITRNRKYDVGIIIAACAAACTLLIASIFVWQNFPHCFIESSGLTPFKIASEYIISLIFIATIAILYLKREHFDPTVWKFLIAAQVFLILGELAFTSYISVFGFMNMLGHLFRLLSVYLFYRAFVVISLTRPYDLLLRELKVNEDRLRDNRGKYRDLVENIDEVILSLDLQGNLTFISPVIMRLYGYTPSEMIGQHFLNYVLPDDRSHYIEGFRRRLNGDYERDEFRFLARSGTIHYVSISPRPMEKDGRIVGFNYVMTDITERKRADDEIKRIKMAVDATSDAIGMSTVEGHHFYQNAAFDRMFGYTMEEVSRLQPAVLYADGDVARKVFGTIMAGTPWQGKIDMIAKNGRQFPVSLRADAIKDENENIIGLIGVHTDITERKWVEEAIRESEKRFRNLVEATSDWVWEVDENGHYTYVSPQALAIAGYTPDELLGKTPFDSMPPEEAARVGEIFSKIVASQQPFSSLENTNLHKDGHIVILDTSGVPVFRPDGTFCGYRGIDRDITERKRAEEAVQAAVKLNQLIDTMSVSESMGYTLDEAERLTTSKIGFFHFVNPDEQTLQLVIWSTETKKHCFIPKEPERNYPVKKAGVWVDCLRERKPVIHNDYASLPHKKGLPEGHIPITRELVVPIFDEDKIIAIIGVGNKATDYAEQDINVLTLLAKNAWTLIQRKQAEEERERIRLWQVGVNRILESVLSPAPLAQKLKIITDGVVETFGADFCRIWLIAKGDLCNTDCMHAEVAEGPHICRFRDKCLHLKASSGRYTHIDGKGHRRVPFGAYKIGRIASGEETRFLTNDVEHDPRVHDHEWAKSLGLVAFSGYRLKPTDSDVLGVFALFARFPISPDMDAILEGLSRAISLAIQKDFADKALRESEEKFRDIFDKANDAIEIFEIRDNTYPGRYIDVNEVACRMMQYSKEEMLQHSPIDFDITDYNVPPNDEVAKKLSSVGIATFETGHKRKDGKIVPVEINYHIITLLGQKAGIAIIRDISSRKQAEEALRASEERFRTMIEQSPLSIEVMSPDGWTLQVNPAFVKLWGVTLEDLKDYNMLKDEQLTRLGIMPYILRGFSGEAVAYPPLEYDGVKTLGFGDKRWVQGSIYPVRDPAGTIRNVILVHEDITERRKVEEALRESEELYRILFEESPISLLEEDFSDIKVWIDTKTNENIRDFRTWLESHPEDVAGCAIMVKVTHINRATMALFGATSHTEFSEGLSTIFTEDSYDSFREEIIALAEGKNDFEGETQVQTLNGERKIVLLKVTVVPGYEQTFSKILVSIIDISDLKQIEKALRQANKQLNLLSSITRHDILNQLMALKGYLELSHDVIDNPETLSGYIKKEQQAANTIEHQITFTRDYQELGVVAPEWQSVNASIKKALTGLPMRDVRVEVDPKNPEIFADRLFEKVFYNLIDNALRYGGAGMKTIRTSSQEIDTRLTILCEDDGVGISAEDKKRLFTRGFGKNTGLGLFLSREILAITGITITENGTPGKGARFEITVPNGMWRMMGANQS
jgi:PAS domain S-box-containing protein